MANKTTSTTCHSCDNPYFVWAQIIAKSAGSPAYRFGIDESVSLPGNQHGFVRDILDGGKIYVVQMFESTEYRCYAWLDMRPEYGYKDICSIYGTLTSRFRSATTITRSDFCWVSCTSTT